MGLSSLLRRSFRKYLPLGVFIVFITLAFPFLLYSRGLVITIIAIFILNISFFTYFLISFYLERRVRRSTSKIILSVILPILYFNLVFPISLILIGEDFSDPLSVRKTLTTMLYLTIAYIPFGILLEYLAR
jgi:hypothetical protein